MSGAVGEISLGWTPESLQKKIGQETVVLNEHGQPVKVELLAALKEAEDERNQDGQIVREGKLRLLSRAIKRNDVDGIGDIPGGLVALKALLRIREDQVKTYQDLAELGAKASIIIIDRLPALIHATDDQREKIRADALLLKALAEKVHQKTTEESPWFVQNLGGNMEELRRLVAERSAEEEDGSVLVRHLPAQPQAKSWGARAAMYAWSFF